MAERIPGVHGQDLPRYSIEEYLEFLEVAEFKHEYRDGYIVAMTGGTATHNQLVRQLHMMLASRLRAPCAWRGSETAVFVRSRNRVFFPDASIVCGTPRLYPTRLELLENPAVIFEVLSPGTAGYDGGEKFDFYMQLPSLREYVLISPYAPRVEYRRRQGDTTTWTLGEVAGMDADLPLTAADCTIDLATLYDGVDFTPRPPEPDLRVVQEPDGIARYLEAYRLAYG